MAQNQVEIQSFEALFRRNYQRLCQQVFRMTNDLEAAEDIVQEVFINFWNRSKEHPIEIPEAYLYRACLNKALDYTSSHKRKDQLLQVHHKEQVQEAVDNPQQQMELQELEQRVQLGIASLPTMCRKVFQLSRYEEMSHKEIAAFLNISPNTVDNHIKKALSILRQALLYLILVPAAFYFIFFFQGHSG